MQIKVIVDQPALPAYRISVFRELAKRPGIDLKVLHGQHPSLPPNAVADGFVAELVPSRHFVLGERRPVWRTSAWSSSAKRGVAHVLVMTWDLHHVNLVPALLRARVNGIATILWGHGYSKADSRWRRTSREQAAKLATAMMFYDHRTARRFLERGWPAEKLHVAPNTVDQAPIQSARCAWLSEPDRLTRFRADHGIGTGPVILFVSRLQPENQVDLLLRATVLLQQSHPGIRTVIVGAGSDHDRLTGIAEERGITSRVTFTGPVYDEMEVAPWFLSATVFCYPANIGLSLLHAFGYGLPVVTSDRMESHNPEIAALEPGFNGLVYRHGDPLALAHALDEVIRNPDKAAMLSKNAIETALVRFPLSQMVDAMEAAIRYAADRVRHEAPLRSQLKPAS